jgi:hypothetical protein
VAFRDPSHRLLAVQQVCATAAALPLAVALCGLSVWNAWLVSQNKTTIEYHEVGRMLFELLQSSCKVHPRGTLPITV